VGRIEAWLFGRLDDLTSVIERRQLASREPITPAEVAAANAGSFLLTVSEAAMDEASVAAEIMRRCR
jgi:hypothetical protein